MISNRNIIFLLILLLVVTRFWTSLGQSNEKSSYSNNPSAITEAFQNQQSNVQVEGNGTIIKILSDDLKGSRHQRVILQVAKGQTLLIAHNIDLAPRVPNLKKGDILHFFGEYEWNKKGGVIHWTHHDPKGKHTGGWLKHNGRIYQ